MLRLILVMNFKPMVFPRTLQTLRTPIVQTYFRHVINAFAYQNNICDASGRLWRFQPHQFRHSFATRLINNGVPQHIVQRLMGHKSPEMTSRYAHIHDATLKEEYADEAP